MAQGHEAIPGFAASFVTGSAAEGIADDHSDIDMSLFFDSFPGEAALMAVKDTLASKPPNCILGSFYDDEVIFSIRPAS